MSYYRKKYFCICEGQQEELYLRHVALLLKNYPQRVVSFGIVYGNANRLEKSYQEYDSAVLFDYDFKDSEFRNNLEMCEKLKKQKNDRNIFHAYSNVNFDLWLILHKENYNRCVWRNDAYINDVRRIYRLGTNENIKNKDVIERILNQITLEDVKSAIRRADSIRKGKVDTDKKFIGSTVCYSNPDFSIHNFLKAVLIDCGEDLY